MLWFGGYVFCVWKDHFSSDFLLEKLGINNIQTLLWYNWLHWFGHVAGNDGCIKSITALEVNEYNGEGRPRKIWRDTINNDHKIWKLLRVDPANRIEWRKKLRINMGAVWPTLSGTGTLKEWQWWWYLKNKKSFWSEMKTFFLASKVLSFRHTKQTSKM